jgi:hypothetical protein
MIFPMSCLIFWCFGGCWWCLAAVLSKLLCKLHWSHYLSEACELGHGSFQCSHLVVPLVAQVLLESLFRQPLGGRAHAFLRDASIHKDDDDKVQMEGDLNLQEDAAFLI